MATYPLPRQIRRPRSTSSFFSSSSSPSPFQTPFYPSSYALIPFKWERIPGIPKTPLNKSLNPRRVPALPPPLRSNSEIVAGVPPPPPLRSNSEIVAGVPPPPPLRYNSEKVARVADRDPFAAAILECVKDPVVKEVAVNGGRGWRRIGLGFGFGLLDRYGSCKASCAVSESIKVLNPRPAVRVSRFGCESGSLLDK